MISPVPSSEAREKFKKKHKLNELLYDEINKLKGDWAGKRELARLRFNKTHTTKNGDRYIKLSAEYGIIRTVMLLRFPKGNPDV